MTGINRESLVLESAVVFQPGCSSRCQLTASGGAAVCHVVVFAVLVLPCQLVPDMLACLWLACAFWAAHSRFMPCTCSALAQTCVLQEPAERSKVAPGYSGGTWSGVPEPALGWLGPLRGVSL